MIHQKTQQNNFSTDHSNRQQALMLIATVSQAQCGHALQIRHTDSVFDVVAHGWDVPWLEVDDSVCGFIDTRGFVIVQKLRPQSLGPAVTVRCTAEDKAQLCHGSAVLSLATDGSMMLGNRQYSATMSANGDYQLRAATIKMNANGRFSLCGETIHLN